MTLDCKANRKLDRSNVADKSPEEAWADIKKASDERDIDDFREALQVYSKACPDATIQDIEKKMREEKLRIYIIALVRILLESHQGNSIANCISAGEKHL